METRLSVLPFLRRAICIGYVINPTDIYDKLIKYVTNQPFSALYFVQSEPTWLRLEELKSEAKINNLFFFSSLLYLIDITLR